MLDLDIAKIALLIWSDVPLVVAGCEIFLFEEWLKSEGRMTAFPLIFLHRSHIPPPHIFIPGQLWELMEVAVAVHV